MPQLIRLSTQCEKLPHFAKPLHKKLNRKLWDNEIVQLFKIKSKFATPDKSVPDCVDAQLLDDFDEALLCFDTELYKYHFKDLFRTSYHNITSVGYNFSPKNHALLCNSIVFEDKLVDIFNYIITTILLSKIVFQVKTNRIEFNTNIFTSIEIAKREIYRNRGIATDIIINEKFLYESDAIAISDIDKNSTICGLKIVKNENLDALPLNKIITLSKGKFGCIKKLDLIIKETENNYIVYVDVAADITSGDMISILTI